jgi:glycosyltransferase involved in cell wall biosynthesis
MTPEQITIAITVFSRRQYIFQAVRSALQQSKPVRVIVLEDCGPDCGLGDYVRQEFGSRVEYFRNPKRRGLFGNWNACMEVCQTPWLSILHDDDWLAPEFVEAMLALHAKVGNCGLYFGNTTIVNEDGRQNLDFKVLTSAVPSRKLTLEDALWVTPFPFPGQLFRVEYARALGGFRATSMYCGDWEMWSKLIDRYGAAQTNAVVAYNRQHTGWDRGTSQVVRQGRLYPLSYVQVKRNLHLLRKRGKQLALDRRAYQSRWPVATRFLVRYGAKLPKRLLAYHVGLMSLSQPPHKKYAAFKLFARVAGPRAVRVVSQIANVVHGVGKRTRDKA